MNVRSRRPERGLGAHAARWLVAGAVAGCGNGDVEEELPAGAFTSGPQIDTFDDLGIDGSSGGGADAGPDTGSDIADTGGSETAAAEGSTGEVCEIPADLTHDADIAPIWVNSCAVAANCHVAGGMQVPDLETTPFETLSNDASPMFGASYLVPGDSDASYVYLKVVGRQNELGGGGAMPIGAGVLTDCERMIIQAWIDDGAPQ